MYVLNQTEEQRTERKSMKKQETIKYRARTSGGDVANGSGVPGATEGRTKKPSSLRTAEKGWAKGYNITPPALFRSLLS